MEYAVLVDPAKCIGCRRCQVACKQWNNLSFNSYTTLRFKLENNETTGDTKWRFFNWRCMHCRIPACAEACPVNAITKYEEGPVVVDQDRCIGCKFCVSACPFSIPKFDPVREKVYKCHMCFNRIPSKEPACVQNCPTGSLLFDTRDTILQKARERKEELKGYIYGDVDNKPLGGSAFIYVLESKPSVYGLPDVGEKLSPSVPVLKQSKWLLVPAAVGALFYLVAWRKRRMAEKEE